MDTKNQPTPIIRAKNSKPNYPNTKQQWVCVMNRNPQVDDEFSIEIAYCVDVIGICSALEKAQVYLYRAENIHTNLEYKIEGREWS